MEYKAVSLVSVYTQQAAREPNPGERSKKKKREKEIKTKKTNDDPRLNVSRLR